MSKYPQISSLYTFICMQYGNFHNRQSRYTGSELHVNRMVHIIASVPVMKVREADIISVFTSPTAMCNGGLSGAQNIPMEQLPQNQALRVLGWCPHQ